MKIIYIIGIIGIPYYFMSNTHPAIPIKTEVVKIKEFTAYEKTAFLIKNFEGFEPKAYKDGNRYSIGYGTISFENEMISKTEANKRFQKHIQTVVNTVSKKYPDVRCNSDLNASLCSFFYNAGMNHPKLDNHLKMLNYESAKKYMSSIVYFKGKRNQGLITRRNKEIEIIEAVNSHQIFEGMKKKIQGY